mgnify:CR=1 FL=1
MRIMESVRSCACGKYAQFKGRASRSEFWWFMLALLILNLLLAGLAIILPSLGSAALGGLSLVMLCPYAAALFRRLHDAGLSGWWAGAAFLLSLATSSMLFLACLLPGQAHENRYGPVPES